MHICPAKKKKIVLSFITFTSISVVCMAFELSNALDSLNASFIVIYEKKSILGCVLYLTIAFKEGWSLFSDKGSKSSNFGILRLIIIFEKKSFSLIVTSSSFVHRVLSSSASFVLSEDCILFGKKGLTFFQNHLFSLINNVNTFTYIFLTKLKVGLSPYNKIVLFVSMKAL